MAYDRNLALKLLIDIALDEFPSPTEARWYEGLMARLGEDVSMKQARLYHTALHIGKGIGASREYVESCLKEVPSERREVLLGLYQHILEGVDFPDF